MIRSPELCKGGLALRANIPLPIGREADLLGRLPVAAGGVEIAALDVKHFLSFLREAKLRLSTAGSEFFHLLSVIANRPDVALRDEKNRSFRSDRQVG